MAPTPPAVFRYRWSHRPARAQVLRERARGPGYGPRRTWNPKAVGEASEAAVVFHLTRAGYDLAKPLGDNARYDLLLEHRDRHVRVQVKTGRLHPNGAVQFPTCSSQVHRGRGKLSYRGQCELFAVYCPELDESYLVPVAAAGTWACALRVRPPRNGQVTGVRWAAGYRADVVDLDRLLAGPDGPPGLAQAIR